MVRPSILASTVVTCLCVALFAFGYPMYVIRPFRPQGASELQLALAVRSWAPWVATAAAAFTIVVLIAAWRVIRRKTARALCVVAAAMTVFFAPLTHVNVFEIMFHPIDSPAAISAAEAKLDPDDMVLAVVVNRKPEPIRSARWVITISLTIG